MWNPESRARHCRGRLRYPSDLSDGEWAAIAPMILPGRSGGRRRSVDIRAVLNGVLYVLETGCQWRHLPSDLPPRSTCHSYLQLWAWDGTLQRIHHELYVRVREQEGREASPSVAVVDSQSVRAAEKGACIGPGRLRRRQEDQRRQVPHPRRHTRAAAEHRGPPRRYSGPRRCRPGARQEDPVALPILQVIFADGGYQGNVAAATVSETGDWRLAIVKRSDQAKGFVVLPKRWLVERSFAWFGRNRRLVRHYEQVPPDFRRLHPPRHDPTHAAQTVPAIIFQDRL